jgi:hypothetical protein
MTTGVGEDLDVKSLFTCTRTYHAWSLYTAQGHWTRGKLGKGERRGWLLKKVSGRAKLLAKATK